MDELITALTRRGRGTRMPLHHPALTAAGQPRCHNQAGRDCDSDSSVPFNLSALTFLSTQDQGPAAASEQLSRLFAVSKSLKGNVLYDVEFHLPTHVLLHTVFFRARQQLHLHFEVLHKVETVHYLLSCQSGATQKCSTVFILSIEIETCPERQQCLT